MKTAKNLTISLGILLLLFLAGCNSSEIDLNKYVSISVDGYDTQGTASCVIDYAAFNLDYMD